MSSIYTKYIESAEYKKATELIDLIRSNECRN